MKKDIICERCGKVLGAWHEEVEVMIDYVSCIKCRKEVE